MATYLVTGGAGFIGSSLARSLLERGETVRVLDDFSTGKRENLAEAAGRIALVEGSVADEATVRGAVEGVDYVFHEAALASVPRSIEDPLSSNLANVTGTLQVLMAARDAGVKRVVYAASSSTYGDQPTLPKVETMAPSPLSPYAVSKQAGEHYCQAFTTCYGLETVSLRYFNVYGPRQDPQSVYAAVIPKFITAMLAGERPTIFGDGEQSRDFTFIDDVVGANLLACTAPEASGHALNVACGDRYSLNELVRVLNRILGTSIEPVYADERAGDVKHSQADILAARDILGYAPSHTLEQGLRKTIEWYSA